MVVLLDGSITKGGQAGMDVDELMYWFRTEFGVECAIGLSMAFDLLMGAPEWCAYWAAQWAQDQVYDRAEVIDLVTRQLFPVPMRQS